VKEVKLLGVDGNVKKIIMYIQKGNPVPVTSCGRRRVERVKSIYKKTKSRKAKKLKQSKNNG